VYWLNSVAILAICKTLGNSECFERNYERCAAGTFRNHLHEGMCWDTRDEDSTPQHTPTMFREVLDLVVTHVLKPRCVCQNVHAMLPVVQFLQRMEFEHDFLDALLAQAFDLIERGQSQGKSPHGLILGFDWMWALQLDPRLYILAVTSCMNDSSRQITLRRSMNLPSLAKQMQKNLHGNLNQACEACISSSSSLSRGGDSCLLKLSH